MRGINVRQGFTADKSPENGHEVIAGIGRVTVANASIA